jgi:hypothetical protein
MHAKTYLSSAAATVAALVIAVGLSGAAQAATDFTGKYLTTDAEGKPLQITLNAKGRAWGHRPGEYMKGAWAAGNHFKKFAYASGHEPKGKPVNKARAVKVQ